MIRYENDCVGCDHCGFCGRKRVAYYYCDNCDDCVDTLYDYDGAELCESCLLDRVPKVEEE